MKNKRAHCYRMGWLEVPEKFTYLKKNSSKRDPTASRLKRVKTETAAKRKAKRLEKSEVQRTKVAAGKAREHRGIRDEEEEEEEEEWPEDLPEEVEADADDDTNA